MPYTKYDYLYERMGPWPQPSPEHPQGEAPSVVHIPKEEQKVFDRYIGRRFIKDLITGFPAALWKAYTQKGYVEIDHNRFDELMLTGINTRYLVPTLDPVDQANFAPILAAAPPGAKFWKQDFTPIGGVPGTLIKPVKPYPGTYVAPSVVLVEEDPGDPQGMRTVAIFMNGLLIRPTDTNAWKLAQYFVLQAAAYGILFTVHPNLHFPFDTVNAVTKTALPVKHTLFQLLQPHLPFQLALNNAVLNSPGSIVSNRKWTIYDPFTARADDGLMSFFVAGYEGIPGNSAYPKYEYASRPKEVWGDYGRFINEYYEPFYTFAKTVTDTIPRTGEDANLVKHWADYIAMWMPGFPKGADIFTGDNLAEAVAGFMWDVSIGHAVDHASFSYDQTVRERCLVIRTPPPTSLTMPAPNPAEMANHWDLLRAYLAERMFFRPVNVARLVDVQYAFTDPALQQAANRFQGDLRAVETRLIAQGVKRYITLDNTSASIQY